MTSFKEFMNDLYGKDNILLSTPPRHSKSFMGEAINTMYQNCKYAYDEVYESVFNEIKGDAGDIYSDEEIHKFIEKYVTFELEVEDRGFTQCPKVVITPKWKMEEE